MSVSKRHIKRRLKLRRRLTWLASRFGPGVYTWTRPGFNNPIGNGGRKP